MKFTQSDSFIMVEFESQDSNATRQGMANSLYHNFKQNNFVPDKNPKVGLSEVENRVKEYHANMDNIDLVIKTIRSMRK